MKWNSNYNFDGENYAPWKARVKALLQAKRLWSIVMLEDLPPPEWADSTEKEDFWNREHEDTAFLMSTLSNEMVISVSNKRYAYDIFQHLEKTYEPRNWGSQCELRDQFVTLKFHDGADMLAHINELKVLVGRLANQGKPINDTEKVCQLLSSLPKSWDSFKSIYYIQETPIAWPSMETNVMAEASRRLAVRGHLPETTTTEANAVLPDQAQQSGNRRQPKKRGGGGGQNHGFDAKRKRRERDSGGECHYCHEQGHYKVDCPTRKRHRSEQEGGRDGGGADVALQDITKSEKEVQHASSVEVWDLAVLVNDGDSVTASEDGALNSESDTSSEATESNMSEAETESTSSSDDLSRENKTPGAFLSN